MAEKDLTGKELISIPEVFADIINVLLLNGEEIVKPETLEPAETVTQYMDEKGSSEQYRDIAKMWKDGNIQLAFFGIENQSKPDKDMPIRVMSYDAGVYRGQLKNKHNEHRFPVITIVLYFGLDKWKTNKTLMECFEREIPKKLKRYVNNYKLNVFSICDLSRKTIAKFKSEFRVVADYFWQMKHNKKYKPDETEVKYIYEIIAMLAAYGGDKELLQSNLQVKGEGKVTKMSDMLRRTLQKSVDKGRAEGLAEGEAKGRIAAIVESVRNMMETLRFTAEAAMDALKIKAADRPAILAAL